MVDCCGINKNRTMKKIILLIVPLIFMSGCSSKKIDVNNKENNQEMVNEHVGLYDIWGLKEIKGEKIKAGKGIILELNTESMTFLGNAGCNNISGNLELSKENLVAFKNIRATRMACPDLSLENEYLKNLENVTSYQIKSLHLLLFNKDGVLLLDYIKMD